MPVMTEIDYAFKTANDPNLPNAFAKQKGMDAWPYFQKYPEEGKIVSKAMQGINTLGKLSVKNLGLSQCHPRSNSSNWQAENIILWCFEIMLGSFELLHRENPSN